MENIPLIKKTLENLNIDQLNEMQQCALKTFKNGKNIVLLAPTGSGKTLCFLLPLLERLDPEKQGVQAMIIAPTRELSVQIGQVFQSMKTGFKVNCCYGGHSIETETNNLKHPPALLIGTPGRLADHIEKERIDTKSIKILILDEFDKSLEFGFKEEMSYIINHLKNISIRMLTSATQDLKIPEFAGMSHPAELNYLTPDSPERLTLKLVRSENKDKLETLFRLICRLGNRPTLVFCNHRESVERVSSYLSEQQIPNVFFHGGLEQDERERALIQFRNRSYHLLITTDLAARGLDIPEIEYIIHYHISPTEREFLHRNGRTARMNALGTTYLILSDAETPPAYLKTLPAFEELPVENVLPGKTDWTTLYIGAGKKDKINKMDIVGLLLKKGQLHKNDLGLIDVLDYSSFVAVKSGKIEALVKSLKNETIKKKKVKMQIAR